MKAYHMKLQISLFNLDSPTSCLQKYWNITLKFRDTGYIYPRLMLRFILKATIIVFEDLVHLTQNNTIKFYRIQDLIHNLVKSELFKNIYYCVVVEIKVDNLRNSTLQSGSLKRRIHCTWHVLVFRNLYS